MYPSHQRNSRPYSGLIHHWFPLIRPYETIIFLRGCFRGLVGWVVISHFKQKTDSSSSTNQKSKSFTQKPRLRKLFFCVMTSFPHHPYTIEAPSSDQGTSDEYWDKELTHRPAKFHQFPNRERFVLLGVSNQQPGRFQQKTSIAKLLKKNCKTYFNKKCYLQAWAEK